MAQNYQMLEEFFASGPVSPLQFIPDPFPEPVPIRLFLKRDDLLHPLVSGNKWRKLKYNLLEARKLGFETLLSYGGAYSNHIHALAAAGRLLGFRTIGIIRGEDPGDRASTTLRFAREQGMELQFISREAYRGKSDAAFREALSARYGPFYELPEGGTNAFALPGVAEGVAEISRQLGASPDYLCVAAGTGGTLAGLVAGASPATQVLGFSVLKGGTFLSAEVSCLTGTDQFRLFPDYHFGGYARTTPELLAFIRGFEARTGVRLEQVYTGKMLYGLYDLAKKGIFAPGSTVVALHTGGLQGRDPALDSPS